jgi:predicted ATPase
MGAALDQISIQGYKSIRGLKGFKLGKLNVLIGANGAGKSNLIDFFRMLRAMAEGGLREFITRSGGGDGFFFNGPKETQKISAELNFGSNAYRFSLAPTVDSELMVLNEACLWTGMGGGWHEHGGGGKEASLKSWKGHKSYRGNWLSIEGNVHESIASWVVYHVHDTSSTAPMRREWPATDYHELRPDASNIAPFLYRLKKFDLPRYQRICDTIRLIAPFFSDFLLEPEKRGDNEVMRLQWKQKGSSFPFQPWQFSDGTIRFICLTTALLQTRPPSTIVIDEPELGLHPVALQILAALIHEASLKTQLLISTQATSLLDHFDAEQIIVAERTDGSSVFRRLETADLEQWIFDYSIGDLVRKNIIETGPHYA